MAAKNVLRVINALFVLSCKLTAETWQLSLRSLFLTPMDFVPEALVAKIEHGTANVR